MLQPYIAGYYNSAGQQNQRWLFRLSGD